MQNLFSQKLSAFLHDPIDKPFILMMGEGHENRACELADKINISLIADSAADHIASAMERAFLPKGASKNKLLQVRFLEDGTIVHPLSGKEISLKEDLSGRNKEEFKNVVNDVFDAIRKNAFKTDKALFFYLWRNLIPLLEKKSSGEIKKFWNIAPADTRIPDHSISEHLKICSACFNATYEGEKLLNNCSLFLFTVGPVQSFISQARKAQDLYWGSFILSYLNWKAIEHVAGEFGPDCILFPDMHRQPLADWWFENELKIDVVNSNTKLVTIPTIPNRFLAVIPERKSDQLRKLGKRTEKLIRDEFKAISDTILKEFGLPKPEKWNAQIDRFLQAYWVFIPWFRDEDGVEDWAITLKKLNPFFTKDKMNRYENLFNYVKHNGEYRVNIGNAYSLLYSFTEKALGASKNIRTFNQLDNEAGRKCSICGERDVQYYVDENSSKNKYKHCGAIQLMHENGDSTNKEMPGAEKNILRKYLSNGEGLCAVCFTKRCSEKYFESIFGDAVMRKGFPSIAEIAQKKFITFIEKNYGEIFHAFKKCFRAKDWDAQYLYEENLTERFFEKQGNESILHDLKEIRKIHKQLMDGVRNGAQKDSIKQSKYYAVLAMDGDSMGKWLSGALAPNFENIYNKNVWDNLPDDFKRLLKGQKRPMTPALHSAISTALKNYSLQFVKPIVENCSGELIYCGGDDVLAFINLDDLLDVMVKLRAAFSGHIDYDTLEVDFTNKERTGFVETKNEYILTMGPTATASMGVCIAHYKAPLNIVLNTVREMEKEGKAIDEDKNAFAIKILKNSGESVKTVFKWLYDNILEPEGTIAILKKLKKEFGIGKRNKKDGFSDTFVHALKDEFEKFHDTETRIGDPIIETEIRRLLARSCMMRPKTTQDRKEKSERIEALKKDLYEIYLQSNEFSNFLSFLNTAVFLTRETTI